MNVMYVFIAAETAEGGRMMSVDEKAREMARQYIPHEGGFSMGGLLQNIIEYFEADVAQLRAERNAAQQRAEQAERERDEARAVIDRAIEILGSPVPDGVVTKDQMANEHLNVNALLTAFRKSYYIAPQAQPAPTVKADDGELSMQWLIDRASEKWDEAGNSKVPANMRAKYLYAAVGDILDIVERLVKGGAS